MIEKVSEESKLAILRKTPWVMSARPSEDGMPAGQIKKMFYTALTDEENSVMAEMERMRQEANASLDAKVDKSSLTDELVACESDRVPTVMGLRQYLDKHANLYRLYFDNLLITSDCWEDVRSVEGYQYEAFVPLPHVTARMVPEACFDATSVKSARLATFCRCEDGGVRFYADKTMENDVVVESLMCSLPHCYYVLAHVDEEGELEISDGKRTYGNADVVAPDTVLTITARGPITRKTILTVNGETLPYGVLTKTIVVDRTVQVNVQVKRVSE